MHLFAALDFISDGDLQKVKTLAPIIGYIASGMAALATILGLRARLSTYLFNRRARQRRDKVRAEQQAQDERLLARLRADWYRGAYQRLVVDQPSLTMEVFHSLTVQQAAAVLHEPLPMWAEGGWERVQVAKLGEVLDPRHCQQSPSLASDLCGPGDGVDMPVPPCAPVTRWAGFHESATEPVDSDPSDKSLEVLRRKMEERQAPQHSPHPFGIPPSLLHPSGR